MLDNPSQTTGAIHRLKEGIEKLTHQQSDALQLATLAGMTPDEAEEYDQRAKKFWNTCKTSRSLRNLNR